MLNFLYPSVGLEWVEKQVKWLESFCKGQKGQALELGSGSAILPRFGTRMEQFVAKSFPLLEEGREVGAMTPVPQGIFTRDREALHGSL